MNFIILEVSNNGEQLKSSHSHLLKQGMGLSNIDDRLKTLYENNYLFKTENCPEGGVKTTIKFPITH